MIYVELIKWKKNGDFELEDLKSFSPNKEQEAMNWLHSHTQSIAKQKTKNLNDVVRLDILVEDDEGSFPVEKVNIWDKDNPRYVDDFYSGKKIDIKRLVKDIIDYRLNNADDFAEMNDKIDEMVKNKDTLIWNKVARNGGTNIFSYDEDGMWRFCKANSKFIFKEFKIQGYGLEEPNQKEKQEIVSALKNITKGNFGNTVGRLFDNELVAGVKTETLLVNALNKYKYMAEKYGLNKFDYGGKIYYDFNSQQDFLERDAELLCSEIINELSKDKIKVKEGYNFYEVYFDKQKDGDYSNDNFSIIVKTPKAHRSPTIKDMERFLQKDLHQSSGEYHIRFVSPADTGLEKTNCRYFNRKKFYQKKDKSVIR